MNILYQKANRLNVAHATQYVLTEKTAADAKPPPPPPSPSPEMPPAKKPPEPLPPVVL